MARHAQSAKHSKPAQLPSGSKNETDLAKLIVTESGGLSRVTQTAVGWTVRNRMIRNGTAQVDHAWHGYQHGKAPTAAAILIAKGILDGTIPDPTDGATHFYTPKIMPKEGEDTTGVDVSGGLESVPGVVDDDGKAVKNYRPGFASTFTEKTVPGVPPAIFKFYQQPGNGHVR